jgi:hypothetical protein
LREIVVPRSKLAEFCAAPWFEEWIKGEPARRAPVTGKESSSCEHSVTDGKLRFSGFQVLGFDTCLVEITKAKTRIACVKWRVSGPLALCPRLCIALTDILRLGSLRSPGVKDDPTRPYRIENVSTTLQVELRHGKAVKFFTMDAVSESPFLDVSTQSFRYHRLRLWPKPDARSLPFPCKQSEFARLNADYQYEKMDLPTVKEVDKIKAKLDQHKEYIMTEVSGCRLLGR